MSGSKEKSGKEEKVSWNEIKMRTQDKTKSLWNPLKAVIGGKFITLSAYIKKSKRKQLNGLILQLKFFEKQE